LLKNTALEDAHDAMPLGKQFETSGTTHAMIQYHNAEDLNLQQHGSANLIPHNTALGKMMKMMMMMMKSCNS
jgi:hypothetical protein